MSEDKPTPLEPEPPEQAAEQPRSSTRVMNDEDVKDVMTITLEKLKEKSHESLAALKESAERLLNESEAARDMIKRLSHPPPEK